MQNYEMKVVLMAGGRGSRIATMRSDVPKPLIPIIGKPVIVHEIERLKKQGFNDFIITVGYKAEQIIECLGNGESLGVHIEYHKEEEPLGNAGALVYLKDQLTENFLLINADLMFDVDVNRMFCFHNERKASATILTHPNNHPYDSGLIEIDNNHAVTEWKNKENNRSKFYKNRVNAGIHIISKKLIPDKLNGKIDLDRDILKPLSGSGKLFAYDSTEYVKDMGTPERYDAVTRDALSGVIAQKNLINKQKAIFLDRDGTINKYVGFLSNIDEFELIPGVAEAIKKINASGYLAIVITNQPVIARGDLSFDELTAIHNKMETLLGAEGAYIDGIYFCPHHPDKGFANEVAELKIDCLCRKPKPGMLLAAAKDYNIDLSQSWMIGDGKNDVMAGKAAGCKTILIGNEGEWTQDYISSSLNSAIDVIIKRM